MESNWAAENLQVIRTLMERSALYRRALAPIMTFNGALGVLAALAGVLAKIDTPRLFLGYWMIIGSVAVASSFLLVRRQALKDKEAFWSPPTRRVTQALLPPLAAGFFLSVMLVVFEPPNMRWLFVFLNVFFYGCALHAAGFFMPRGMKLFAWIIIALGAAILLVLALILRAEPSTALDHTLMGFFFGAVHLAYGIYLYLTEKGNTPA